MQRVISFFGRLFGRKEVLHLRMPQSQLKRPTRVRFQSEVTKPVPLDSRLVSACFGDRVKAERLLHYEFCRCPGISQAAAVESAIERLARDRS